MERLKRILTALFLLALAGPVLWVLTYKWINPPITYLQVREGCNCPEGSAFSKDWVSKEKIAADLPLAVVSAEDQNFMKHRGLDFSAISKAEKFNAKSKTKKRGASTVTQQVAKNVFLWPNRSTMRKVAEVYFASLIELIWSKDRIMEVYLNVLETGPCAFGVEAASHKYFKKSASDLTREQCALITAVIPSPRRSNPAKPSSYISRRKEQIMRQMRMLGKDYFARYQNYDPDKPDPKTLKRKSKRKKK